ncbi:hypothetical protein OV203_47920 [Nannocystis sp. ILAH1]|uniref:hypothetical protein n=1 Tax=Nannocystis sp. ILAH1 TaxID=2996789 RepID=UPI0022710294|nr:hypothetical protein [Nannocystis sp. ILAH1]MCY0994948.1 hypothetical protein [Nannocystis sp. ILAH1]
MLRGSLPSLTLVGVVVAPLAASAANGLEPRTPVAWPDSTPCLTVVDRQQEVMLHLAYGVPYEDVDVTVDEVADSRRHQFVAFCRDHSREEFLPIWLTWKDVEAAAAKMLVDPMLVEDDAVLETSSVWQDCWFPITPDDARRPITFAEARKGVDWDTTALPAGAYVVQGYTWEPAVNIYSQRPGVVHVVDGLDLAAVGPAAAVTTTLDFTFAEDTYAIDGCTRALPGSTLSVYWSITGTGGLDWKLYSEDVPVEGESFSLQFLPPPETSGRTVALRVDVTDPMQRTFSAYPLNLLTVLPGSSGGTTSDTTAGCNPEAAFVGDPCETSTDATTGEPGNATTSTTSTSTGDPATTGTSADGSGTTEPASSTGPTLTADASGCSCETTASASLAWVSLLALGRRRRRTGRRNDSRCLIASG